MGEGEGIGGDPVSTAFFHLLDRADHVLNRMLDAIFGDTIYFDRSLWPIQISSRSLLLATVGLILLGVLPSAIEWLLRRCGFLRANYRQELIPQAYGLFPLLWSAALLLLDSWIYPGSAAERRLWLACIVCFGMIGLVDDLWGSKKVKGFRGHLTVLLRERRVTTGLIKAVGGLLAATWLSYQLHPNDPGLILLSAAIIALSANAMNLLDLRPGRACGVFCTLALLMLAVTWKQRGGIFVPALAYLCIPVLAMWPRDADARVMLGDTGSNALGAALGLGIAVRASVLVEIMVLIALAALHIVAERYSLTQIIERNSLLRMLDRWTGVRAREAVNQPNPEDPGASLINDR